MSTRCQLRFIDSCTDCVAQVYRHSDGYPESVLPTLQHLQRLLRATQAQRDATYAAAQFLFYDKLWTLERTLQSDDSLYEGYPDTVADVLTVESWRDCNKTPSYLLGHGVEDPSCGIHGDEEFLYVVELPEKRHGDWRLKVAGRKYFPRWDSEDTDHAFEVAEWGYDGPLDGALTEVNNE